MFKSKMSGKQRIFQQLIRVAPAVKSELDDGLKKGVQELETSARSFAPKKSGAYAQSINGKPLKRGDGIPAYGLFASWVWRFIEFGTKPARKGQRIIDTGGNSRKARRSHPGTRPRPHIFPAFRILRKRIRSRTTRVINKAVKRVTG